MSHRDRPNVHLGRVLLADNLRGEEAEAVADWLRHVADNIVEASATDAIDDVSDDFKTPTNPLDIN